jgi:repressor LexA
MRAISKRQHATLDFVVRFIRTNGYSPNFQEIANGIGLRSLATVHKHLNNLEKKGFIQRDYNCARSIEVLRGIRMTKPVCCPNCGTEVRA